MTPTRLMNWLKAPVTFLTVEGLKPSALSPLSPVQRAHSFNREEIRSEGFLETIENLHRLGDDDLTRYVFALESLKGLIAIHGYEELRPHFDSLHEALNRRIDGDTE